MKETFEYLIANSESVFIMSVLLLLLTGAACLIIWWTACAIIDRNRPLSKVDEQIQVTLTLLEENSKMRTTLESTLNTLKSAKDKPTN